MQRYHAASCTGAVNNSIIGGSSARDTARSDSSSLPVNFSHNSRRTSQLTPYKQKCEKEPLNSRLGPPDFHPQTPSCPEETLTREYVQSGYRDTVEGLEDSREISLSQVQAFSKPVVFKCKEAIRKRLRAINESRAQKRKAGQVYGIPLSGSLLTKPGTHPDQKPCGEDLRKKWIEGLSQQHKRLRLLADYVPDGYRKKSLFEVLIRNNVPLLRATWFIKITYLNQVRPSSGVSSRATDKTQISRTELWTKDVAEYLQILLDEFTKINSRSLQHNRDRLAQMGYNGSIQNRDPTLAVIDSEEPSLHFKWWYMVRLLQWHQSEGLLLPSLIIDWVLNQLQEREMLEILQLLLPIIYGVLETVVQSQTYVRTLVEVALRYIREPSPGGSDLVDNSRRAYTVSALVEMLRYLILAVPDSFVSMDCFPLPQCVIYPIATEGSFVSKACDDAEKLKSSSAEVTLSYKGLDARYQSLSFVNVVTSIQKHSDNLAKAASPGFSGYSVAKAVDSLDKTLLQGDIREAYKFLFQDLCDGAIDQGWIAEVSPCLRSSLKCFGTISSSFVCSVFFLCEWATCDYRDFRTAPPDGLKLTGRKDFSQVYIVIRLLKLTIKGLRISSRRKNKSCNGVSIFANSKFSRQARMGNGSGVVTTSESVDGLCGNHKDIFESPGPLHDIVVCWIDQHEVRKGESSERVQLLILELVRSAIFYPHVYVRQLLVSGIMDMNGPLVDIERRKRHHKIIKQLPGDFVHHALEEAKVAEGSKLLEVMHIYSNERRFVLKGLLDNHHGNLSNGTLSAEKQNQCPASARSGMSLASQKPWVTRHASSNAIPSNPIKSGVNVGEIKASISLLLQLPNSCMAADSGSNESQGSTKRQFGSICSNIDVVEMSSCEECRRLKKQKLSDERGVYLHPHSPGLSDDEDNWWVRKGAKSVEIAKTDPPQKPTKQVSRSRQKGVRKTQSLAQLAAARIEGSLGASTSHVCDNKVGCPHHRSGVGGEIPKSVNGSRKTNGGDIVAVGKSLKQLRYVDKRSITIWLLTSVKQILEESERTVSRVGQHGRPCASDEKNSIQWKLGEDELSSILYLMDVSNDLVSSVKFLLWLLPKVYCNPAAVHSGRNISMMPRNSENSACVVAELFLLSSLRRYENILVALDLVPEALSAAMCRASAVMASSGRFLGSSALSYARHLLKKYGTMTSVIEWEKSFKATCDKRLLSEFDSVRSLDGDLGFPLGVPAGVEDLDDFLRQKISSGRLSRVGATMRDIVQRHVEEAFHHSLSKDRKTFAAGMQKGPGMDKWDDSYQIAQQIIMGLLECMRQTGGAAQEGDPSLVSSAVSAIVNNVGPTIAKMPDLGVLSNYASGASSANSMHFARNILHIHLLCLCLLKDALGERQSRVFDIALAAEATSSVAGAYAPGKASRSQFQLSPESHDSNDISNRSAKAVINRGTKIAGAVSALVIGAIIHGVTTLERMVTVFRLREGLDFIHFIRSTRPSSNGNARSYGSYKVESSIEVYIHWFRMLVGNCRTACDGLIVDFLGERSILALSRMQRMLSLNLILPPAYSIFAFVLWKPFILSTNAGTREDIHQLYQSLIVAISDAIKHQPFRDVCLRDSQSFYDFLATDNTDAEFAAMLELNGSDLHLKSKAFIPLRGRLFVDAIVDCKITCSKDDNSWASGVNSNVKCADTGKLLDKLVQVLDNLQPSKFHWQWMELRLLLNEQALVEKLEMRDTSLSDAIRSSYAIRSSSSSPDKAAASDNENNFIQIILTRLLARPDAAPLFSEVVHLFGRSLEDSMLLQARWFLAGRDVLFGRKSIRQRLINIAESEGLSTKTHYCKPWGWICSDLDPATNRERKPEVLSLEEGEVIEEGATLKKDVKESAQIFDAESSNVYQQHVTERALVELLLPCIDQSSDDSRNNFASELIKQLDKIEQQLNAIGRGSAKQVGMAPGMDSPATKGNNRKGIRGSSPLARRHTGTADSSPSSPQALRASMSLRLQLLMRLLPAICAEGETSRRKMRHDLASVIIRLLGNRIIYEDADLSYYSMQSYFSCRDKESTAESSSSITALSSESLFDRLLFVLHGLLSSRQPSWLRSKLGSKSNNESSKNVFTVDRENLESLQNDLDQMQLNDVIRWRIQAAMPVVIPHVRHSLTLSPPSVSVSAIASLQPSISNSDTAQKSPVPLARSVTNVPGKMKSLPLQQDNYIKVDPWTLLEDGAGAGQSSSNTAVVGSGDQSNLRAASWLKGAVRVRRTDLTYIGAVDDDS